MKPEFARGLIRTANREGFNATEVQSLLDFAEGMIALSGEEQNPAGVYALTEMWKESFDEP